MIKTQIVGDYAVEAHLDEKEIERHAALVRVMTTLGLELRGIVVDDKLSGQVLKRRTGNLARSVVDQSPTVADQGSQITSAVGFNATTTPYGVFHEFGVPHDWLIEAKRAKALSWIGGDGKRRFAKSVIHPPLPERSFLRSSLADIRPRVAPRIAEAIGGTAS